MRSTRPLCQAGNGSCANNGQHLTAEDCLFFPYQHYTLHPPGPSLPDNVKHFWVEVTEFVEHNRFRSYRVVSVSSDL
jgi:hypothetical protein